MKQSMPCPSLILGCTHLRLLCDMRLDLPPQFTEETIFEFLSMLIHRGAPRDLKVQVNFNTLHFIDPVGQVTLSNTIGWLQKKGVKVTFLAPDTTNPAVRFLDDAQFFSSHLKNHQTILPAAHLRETTLPITRIQHSQAGHWLRGTFVHWMAERTEIPVPSLVSIQSSLMEIFNNIKDHSEEQIGCCAAQHFPKNRRIIIAIADFGVGIPTQMSKKYHGSNSDLIMQACDEGVSTKSIPQNRGAGLYLLVQNVVRLNHGMISIYSNDGKATFGTLNNHHKPSKFYPGTLFIVIFDTDTIVPDEEEDFQWS
ncbi:MAG: hypothetical protein HQL96_12650 [Magnetococcales bacterium]|nr:hypothetical protein [Magnetococcales bacterium]